MDFLQIRNFQTIAKYGNMTRAAEVLYISQPALSLSLQRLEQELGVLLFDRVGRTISLNECGKIFLERSFEMMGALNNAQAEMQLAGALPSTTVNVCWSYKCMIDDYLLHYMDENPGIQLNQYFVPTFQVAQELEQSSCDFAIVGGGTPDEYAFEKIVLPDSNWYIAVPVGHPLAKKESVRLAEFADDPFISYAMETGHKNLTERMCKKAGFECNMVYQAAPGHCLDLVAERGWLMLIAADMVGLVAESPYYQSRIVFHRLNEIDSASHVYLMWNKNKVRSPAAQHFFEYMKSLNRPAKTVTKKKK